MRKWAPVANGLTRLSRLQKLIRQVFLIKVAFSRQKTKWQMKSSLIKYFIVIIMMTIKIMMKSLTFLDLKCLEKVANVFLTTKVPTVALKLKRLTVQIALILIEEVFSNR